MTGRVLGLDVGTRRIGIAVSDESRMLAREFMTLTVDSSQQAISRITGLITELVITTVVVGLPLTMNGEEGEQARITRLFGSSLQRATEVPVVYVDERMTSKISDAAMHEMSVSRHRKKQRRDQLSALFILQAFLDSAHTGMDDDSDSHV